MKAICLSLLLVSLLCPLSAQESPSQWTVEFGRALDDRLESIPGGDQLGPLALGLAREISGKELRGLAPAAAAVLALELAESLDLDLRTGKSYQEAKARSVQVARLVLRDLAGGRHSRLEALGRMRSRQERLSGSLRAGLVANPLNAGGKSPIHAGPGHSVR
jgi:hypothetical protein